MCPSTLTPSAESHPQVLWGPSDQVCHLCKVLLQLLPVLALLYLMEAGPRYKSKEPLQAGHLGLQCGGRLSLAEPLSFVP